MNARYVSFFSTLFCLFVLQAPSASAEELLFKKLGVKALEAKPVPQIVLPNIENNKVDFSIWRGRLVLINFWATWCSPCLTEMPALNRLHEHYRDRGFVVVAINTDSHEKKRIKTIIRKLKLNFPILLDVEGEISEQLKVSGMPASYLVNGDGQLLAYIEGSRDWDGKLAHALVEKFLPVK